jgi:hypothetical protein
MNDTNNGRKDENTGRIKSTGISSLTDLKQISRIISALNLIWPTHSSRTTFKEDQR